MHLTRRRITWASAAAAGAGALAASLLPFGSAGAAYGTLEARGTDIACAPGETPNTTFSDVNQPEGSVFKEAIDCIAFYRITQGTTATTYTPGANVSRAQLAAFTVRLVDTSELVEIPANPPDAFSDDNGITLEAEVNRAAALGIVLGTGPGVFNPGAPVNRGQMAAFINRSIFTSFADPGETEYDYFTDDNGNVFEADINRLAEIGVVVGNAGGGYGPGTPVTRQQMALFLARAEDFMAEDGVVTGPPR